MKLSELKRKQAGLIGDDQVFVRTYKGYIYYNRATNEYKFFNTLPYDAIVENVIDASDDADYFVLDETGAELNSTELVRAYIDIAVLKNKDISNVTIIRL